MLTKASHAIVQLLVTCSLIAGLSFPVRGQGTPVGPLSPSGLNPGAVVEEVKSNSAADRAGLQKGDVILSWSRDDAHGQITSPFDLSEVEVEQGPRGTVVLKGTRGAEERTWMLHPEPWDLRTRPNLTGQMTAGAVPESAVNSIPWLSAWFSWKSAESLAREKQWDKADEKCHNAAQHIQASGPALTALLLKNCADLFVPAPDSTRSEKYYQQALASSEKENPNNLSTAAILSAWGKLAYNYDDLPRADERLERVLAIQRQLVPGSLALAFNINRLGVFLQDSGDLERSAALLEEALAIREKLAPNTTVLATALQNLGDTYTMRGDLEKSERYLARALELWEKLVPDSNFVAGCLIDRASAASDRGDWAQAELLLRKAMALQQKLNGKPSAAVQNNLGLILQYRGQLVEAEQLFRQSLAASSPGSLAAAMYIENLGELSRDRGDLDEAEKWLQQAIELTEKLAPKSLGMAIAYTALADVYLRRGNLTAAEAEYKKALAIEEANAPHSKQRADALKMLGHIARKKGDLSGAEERYLASLNLQDKSMAMEKGYAETLLALADLELEIGRSDKSQQLFAQGFATLENQTGRIGGVADIRSGFRARFDAYCRDYISLLIRQNQPEVAFEVLERSRARSLLEMLSEARVDVYEGVDPKLLELERNLQGEIAAKANRRVALLAGDHTQLQVSAITKEIESLVAQYEATVGQIRISSPAYAALVQPQPLHAQEIRTRLLDSQTLLLEYSLGEKRSYVFAVGSDRLQVHELPGRAVLEKRARQVYGLLTVRNKHVPGETGVQKERRLLAAAKEYNRAAAELSDLLLGPVVSQLRKKRLLIVSDGVLAYIPFAALPDPASSLAGTSKTAPLVVRHEIVSLPSASVLSVLRQQALNRKPATKAVAVLADPVFDPHDPRVAKSRSEMRLASSTEPSGTVSAAEPASSDSQSKWSLTRSAADVGITREGQIRLPRLLSTRQEADVISSLTAKGEGLKAVDFDANRATATSPELGRFRIVHFATHGLLDSVHPELSGLVFSMVDKTGRAQNGFLELQDIYNLNLPVDLVVLSACETGLGKQINGEGLIGLTRGFMHAGASRVVASLWKISDKGTATLMANFYKALEKDHMAPAAALRAAQIKMLQQQRWNSPYYWAAFQIHGEWK